jgi:hypothetical protein
MAMNEFWLYVRTDSLFENLMLRKTLLLKKMKSQKDRQIAWSKQLYFCSFSRVVSVINSRNMWGEAVKIYRTIENIREKFSRQSERKGQLGSRKRKFEDNILLHVQPLLGNVLENKFPRRQILGKQAVTRLRNNRWGCVFYVVRVEQRWSNGVIEPVSNQRLGIHTSA